MMPDQNGNNVIDTNSLLCYEVREEPPVARPNGDGREYTLVTDRMGSLDVGAPVLYKQLDVGELLNYRLSKDGKIEINIFIQQPYYKFINSNTRFWNASGAEFNVDSAGAEFRMESLTSLLAGGVAFETPPQDVLGDTPASSDGMRFELFTDYKSSQEKRYQYKLYYTLFF